MDLKRLFSLFVLFLFGFGLNPVLTFALSTTSVTGYTSPMVIGTADDMEIEFTVDTSELTWLNDDYLWIAVSSSLAISGWGDLDISVEFDEDTNNDGIGETAIPENIVQTRGQYLIDSNSLYIYWDEDAWVADSGDTLRILINDLIPQFDNDNFFSFTAVTATEGVWPIDTETILFEVPDAAASVTLGDNAGVGETGETTISFTSPIDMDGLDYFSIVFPNFVDISAAVYQSQTFGGAGGFSCTPTGQHLDCVPTGNITKGAGSVILSGITTTSIDTTDITEFYLFNLGAWYMATDVTVALTDSHEPAPDSGGSSSSGGTPVHGASTSTSTSNSSTSTDETSTTEETSSSSSDSEDNDLASPFTDLSTSSPYFESVMHLYELGVITGYPDDTIRVMDTINRAELMTLLVRSLDAYVSSSEGCFSDVNAEWFSEYICYASEQNWVDGYPDQSFKPGETANTVEVIKMILNVNGVEVRDRKSGETWYTPYVEVAQDLSLISNNLNYSNDATRGFVFTLLSDLLTLIPTTL